MPSFTYLTVEEFKSRSVMPADDVDFIETASPGFLLSRLAIGSSRINARLAKRYAVPFAAPYPEIVLAWLVAIVTVEAYQKRGWNPDDEQSKQIAESAALAIEEMKEAADSNEGLFELPLRAEDAGTSGVSKGGPLGYAEADPYTWTDVQRDAVG